MKWSDRPMGNCYRCYYATRKRNGGECACARYPKWIDVYDRYRHFCGEFVQDPSADPYGQMPSNYAQEW